jgi:ribonuclease T1
MIAARVLGRVSGLILLAALAACGGGPDRSSAPATTGAEPVQHALRADEIAVDALPREAVETLRLIRAGGPFPYKKDGTIFGNRERRLPLKRRGYYREYTVKTPGVRHRGARRIVAGTDGEFYYTPDHYETFKRIRE